MDVAIKVSNIFNSCLVDPRETAGFVIPRLSMLPEAKPSETDGREICKHIVLLRVQSV